MSRQSQDSWSTGDGKYSLRIRRKVITFMCRLSSRSPEWETGGVLIGFYSADLSTVVITQATPPPLDSTRSHSWFLRGVAGLTQLFERLWRQRERVYYVGEWHYHPESRVMPSAYDFAQMAQIARGTNYQCNAPVMLIVGMQPAKTSQPSIRAFVCPIGMNAIEFLRDRGGYGSPPGAIHGR